MEVTRTYKGSSAFRHRIALACLTGIPVKISDIRIHDSEKPGLHGFEGDIIRLVEELSDGMEFKMDEKTLLSVSINPGLLIGCEEGDLVLTCTKDRGLTYYLEFLMMIGPFCKKGLDIILRGVTDHPGDVSLDSFCSGALSLAEKCGLGEADFKVEIKRRGLLPEGGGLVRFRCQPVKRVKPFQLLRAGRVKSVKGTVFTCHLSPLFATRAVDRARGILAEILNHVEIAADLCTGEKAGKSRGMGISLTAETMKGFVYTSDDILKMSEDKEVVQEAAVKLQSRFLAKHKIEDLISNKKSTAIESERDEPACQLGENAVCRLLTEIMEGGVCDSQFQWIPILCMALAEDHSPCRVVTGRLSPHSIELLQTLDEFLDIRFNIEPYAVARSRYLANHDADVDQPEDEGEGQEDDEEAKEAIVEDREQIEKVNHYNRMVLSCIGLGIPNMARKTF